MLRFSGRIRLIAQVAVASVVMMWPALYNRQPFYHTDTTAYVRGADAGFQKVMGITTSWSEEGPAESRLEAGSDGDSNRQAYRTISSIKDKSILAGRSIYYGLLLYVGQIAGDFWLTIGIQCVLLVLTVVLTARHCGVTSRRSLFAVFAVLLLTPAPLFASFLMPDIFAAFTVLSCAFLILRNDHLRGSERTFWVALLVAALLFHASHVVLAASLAAIGGALWLCRSAAVSWKGLALVCGALLFSYLGELGFSYGVTRYVGQPPIRPPFLMARLIDDGPGYRYLRANCPRRPFVVCEFLDRMPLSTDAFLWNRERDQGVFSASDPATRLSLADEQSSFVLAVVLDDPVGVARASLINAVRQSSAIALPDFEYSATAKDVFSKKIPVQSWRRMQSSAAYLGTMPTSVLSMLSRISTVFGIFCLVYSLIRRRYKETAESRVAMRVACFVIAGLALNAAICGVSAGPHDRYQARVIWLLPLMGLILCYSVGDGWWRRRAAAGGR